MKLSRLFTSVAAAVILSARATANPVIKQSIKRAGVATKSVTLAQKGYKSAQTTTKVGSFARTVRPQGQLEATFKRATPNGSSVYRGTAHSGSYGRGLNQASNLPAKSATNSALLGKHASLVNAHGKSHVRGLPDGRIRYYGEFRKSQKPGRTFGQRNVREWNPQTDKERTWLESLNHKGHVIRVRPIAKGKKRHFEFNDKGEFVKSW